MRAVGILVAATLAAACDPEVDEAPRLPGELSPTCGGDVSTYLVDELSIGTDTASAYDHSFDFDADGEYENLLGNAAGGGLPLPIQETTDAAIAAGSIVLALRIEQCANDESRVTLLPGVRADLEREPPRVHLQGFPTVPAVGTDALGRLAGDVAARDGAGWFPISSIVDLPGTPPSWIHVYGVSARLDVDAQSVSGSLGFAPRNFDVMRTIVPAVVRHVPELLAGQPGCPLACEDETLALMMAWLDRDESGVVDEVEFTDLLHAFVRDDLDLLHEIDGALEYWPGHDDDVDSISFGVGIHAIRAELVTE